MHATQRFPTSSSGIDAIGLWRWWFFLFFFFAFLLLLLRWSHAQNVLTAARARLDPDRLCLRRLLLFAFLVIIIVLLLVIVTLGTVCEKGVVWNKRAAV